MGKSLWLAVPFTSTRTGCGLCQFGCLSVQSCAASGKSKATLRSKGLDYCLRPLICLVRKADKDPYIALKVCL
jgi:hypothetical protein